MHSNLKVLTKNSQMTPAAESVRADELARQVQDKSYERVIVRDYTSGKLINENSAPSNGTGHAGKSSFRKRNH